MSFFCFHPGNVGTSDPDAGKFLEVTLIKIYDVIFVHIQYHVYITIARYFYVELKFYFFDIYFKYYHYQVTVLNKKLPLHECSFRKTAVSLYFLFITTPPSGSILRYPGTSFLPAHLHCAVFRSDQP